MVLCPLCMDSATTTTTIAGGSQGNGEEVAREESGALQTGGLDATEEADSTASAEIPTFSYREIIDSIQSRQNMVCQQGRHEVSVERAAPDMLLAGVRCIKESELRKEKMIGDGGFGVVYRGTWNRAVVAIKVLSPAAEVCP
jgi:hypothetical protein